MQQVIVYSGSLCLQAGGIAGLVACSCTQRPLGAMKSGVAGERVALFAAEEVSDAKRVSAEQADASKATLSVWKLGS